MKNPEIMDANDEAESLSIMFHKDNCSVIAIQDATEESVTGADLVSKQKAETSRSVNPLPSQYYYDLLVASYRLSASMIKY